MSLYIGGTRILEMSLRPYTDTLEKCVEQQKADESSIRHRIDFHLASHRVRVGSAGEFLKKLLKLDAQIRKIEPFKKSRFEKTKTLEMLASIVKLLKEQIEADMPEDSHDGKN